MAPPRFSWWRAPETPSLIVVVVVALAKAPFAET